MLASSIPKAIPVASALTTTLRQSSDLRQPECTCRNFMSELNISSFFFLQYNALTPFQVRGGASYLTTTAVLSRHSATSSRSKTATANIRRTSDSPEEHVHLRTRRYINIRFRILYFGTRFTGAYTPHLIYKRASQRQFLVH
jgi:hypothetical protein